MNKFEFTLFILTPLYSIYITSERQINWKRNFITATVVKPSDPVTNIRNYRFVQILLKVKCDHADSNNKSSSIRYKGSPINTRMRSRIAMKMKTRAKTRQELGEDGWMKRGTEQEKLKQINKKLWQARTFESARSSVKVITTIYRSSRSVLFSDG